MIYGRTYRALETQISINGQELQGLGEVHEGNPPDLEYLDCAPVANHEGIKVGGFHHFLVDTATFDRRFACSMPVGHNAYTETVAFLRELARNAGAMEEFLPNGPMEFQSITWEKTEAGYKRVPWRYQVRGATLGSALGLFIVEVENG